MKKLIYCALALAAGLFAASCQQENLEPVAQEGTVTYTIEVPEVVTKAIADGKNVDRLFYEVYKTDAENQKDLSSGAVLLYKKDMGMVTSNEATSRANVTLNLVQNQYYTVLFWAQCGAEGQGVYDVDDLRAVTYKDAASIESNHENYAAFYAVDCISDTTPRDKKVYLKRPFAQLNIGTTYTIDPEKDPYAIQMLKSEVTVKQIPTVFNVATSEVSGVQEFTFNMQNVPGEGLTVNDDPYQYVAMNYMFAGENRTAEVSYTINAKMTAQDGTAIDDVVLNRTVVNVPLKENYRTNIVGNLLTSSTEYEVIVDEKWVVADDEPIVVEVASVASAQELIEAVENGTTEGETNIKLEGDIDLNDLFNVSLFSTKAGNDDAPVSLVIPAGKEIVLDLQGYTLYQANNVLGHSMINNQGKLTLKGEGKIVYTYEGTPDATYSKGNQTINNAGVLIVDGTTVENATAAMSHASYAINTNAGAKLVVNSGTIQNLNGHALRQVSFGLAMNEIEINGGLIKGTRAIQVQLPGSNASQAPEMQLTLNGGILESNEETYNLAIYAYSHGQSGENVNITINGGTLNGNVGLNATITPNAKVLVKGGEINGVYGVFTYASSDETNAIQIVGGTFVADPSYYVEPGYKAIEADGKWNVIQIYTQNGNEYTLLNAEAMKWFAAEVNEGRDYFEGKTVTLGADIDLNDEEWTPIGSAYKDHGFMGNFDGNGYTVKNLSMINLPLDSDGYVYAGLFGVTEGTDKDNQNYIKNLTIENVTIQTTGHIAAAAIAYPYYTALENITVKGNVTIKGGDYTAGVLAYTRRCVDAKNITISAIGGSYIEGNQTVGGVISDIQMNGGLTANYSNFKATGVTVKGTKNVGGISGIISKQTLNGATVENLTIVCDNVRKGIISGSVGEASVINGVSVNNVTGAEKLVGSTYDSGKESKVTIDGVVYEFLENGQCKVDGVVVATSNEELKSALASESEVLVLAGAYTFPASSVKAGTTINCEAGVVFTGTSSLNIKGATVIGATFKNEGGQAVSGTIYGTFKNCTFIGTETLRWCYTTAGQTSLFENCVVKTTLRGVHFDVMDGDVVFKNCEINGFNAYSGAGTMTFEGCTFGHDSSKYNGLNIYTNTNVKDCQFNFVSANTNFIDMEGTEKTLIIENCTATLDGEAAHVSDFVGGSKLDQNTVIYK